MEPHHPLVVRLTRPASLLRAARFRRGPFGRAGSGIRWSDGPCGVGQDGRLAGQAALQDLAGILQEVKAVGDLLGLRRPQGRCGGIVAAPVATDAPYLGTLLHPEREAQRRAVGQPVDDTTPFQVEEDGAGGAAAPEGEVVDAQHAHWRRALATRTGDAHWRHGRIVTAGQEAQDRLIGDPHAQGRRDRFGAAAACGHPQGCHLLDQADGLARPRSHIVL